MGGRRHRPQDHRRRRVGRPDAEVRRHHRARPRFNQTDGPYNPDGGGVWNGSLTIATNDPQHRPGRRTPVRVVAEPVRVGRGAEPADAGQPDLQLQDRHQPLRPLRRRWTSRTTRRSSTARRWPARTGWPPTRAHRRRARHRLVARSGQAGPAAAGTAQGGHVGRRRRCSPPPATKGSRCCRTCRQRTPPAAGQLLARRGAVRIQDRRRVERRRLNSASGGGHHVRFYPLRGESGNIIANTYFMCVDFSAGPDATAENFRFQDQVYIVSNLKPAPRRRRLPRPRRRPRLRLLPRRLRLPHPRQRRLRRRPPRRRPRPRPRPRRPPRRLPPRRLHADPDSPCLWVRPVVVRHPDGRRAARCRRRHRSDDRDRRAIRRPVHRFGPGAVRRAVWPARDRRRRQSGADAVTSQKKAPPADAGWTQETALDVEWAHATAPGAHLLLVEAASAKTKDLVNAVDFARNQPGVSVVTMSFGGPEFNERAPVGPDLHHAGRPRAGHVRRRLGRRRHRPPTGRRYRPTSWRSAAPRSPSTRQGNYGRNPPGPTAAAASAGSSRSRPTRCPSNLGRKHRNRPGSRFQRRSRHRPARLRHQPAHRHRPGRARRRHQCARPRWPPALVAIVNQGRALAGKAPLDSPATAPARPLRRPGRRFHTTSPPAATASPPAPATTWPPAAAARCVQTLVPTWSPSTPPPRRSARGRSDTR